MLFFSIGIPTWNGEKYLHRPLETILPQVKGLEDRIEIVFSDNASVDRTREIIKDFTSKYPFIKYYRNEENVGADRNYDLVVKRSRGKYVWLFTDNDYLKESGIKKVLGVIEKNPGIDAIFVNYIGDVPLNLKEDILCKDGSEFFDKSDFKSGLVLSNIVKKESWEGVDTSKYFYTNWIHIGTLVEMLSKGRGYIIATPYLIQGASEEIGQRWGGNGTFVQVGLRLVKIIRSMEGYGYDKRVIRKCINVVRGGNILYLPLAKAIGLKVDRKLLKDMHAAYADCLSFWLLDLPILLVPNIFYKIAFKIVYPARKSIKKTIIRATSLGRK